MINRYSHDLVSKVWEDENKYNIWFEVELAICKAFEEKQIIPSGTYKAISSKARVHLDRIYELEKITKHEVVAFVNSIVEQIGSNGAWFHYSVTSSDIMDTSYSKMLYQSGVLILNEIGKLLEILKNSALKYKDIICAGRTHGIHAEPMSFGLKFLSFYDELIRHKVRIEERLEKANICIISGAVGSYSLLDPEIESRVASILGMKTHNITSQVVTRDVYGDLINAYALCGGCIERVSVELRNLQRTELGELVEEFTKGQTGSSAMPHKRNPISAENLTGCARMLRGYASMVLENQALWHERDISHSSVERVVGSDSSILLAYMLKRLQALVERISVNKKNVKRNLDLTNGLIYSSFVLAKLMSKGLARDKAYKLVQGCASKVWEKDDLKFKDILLKSSEIISIINKNEIEDIFNNKNVFKNIEHIYSKVLKK